MDDFKLNYFGSAGQFFRRYYFWWYKDAPIKWTIFSANILGFLSVALLIFSPDTWGNYFLITFIFFLVFFVCNMGLAMFPLMVAAFFAIRWGWIVPLLYSPYLFFSQLYKYLRHGDWVPHTALSGISNIIDTNFLYQQQDWKGLKETSIAVLEYVPYSIFLLFVALLWFILARVVACDIDSHE